MRQVVFTERNENKWKKVETFLAGRIGMNADDLAHYYIEITDDLSYVKTFYPNSPLIQYLNGLAFNLHNRIYKNKAEKKNRWRDFWTMEVPVVLYRHRNKLLSSALIFIIAIAIGIFSSAQDDTFVRLIMGDSYVNMTLDNIEAGDPMAVYKGASEGAMLFGIGVNNIRVSFIAFALGILASVLTGFILFSNGIMVGAFIYMFVKKGLFWLSFTTIFIHGTLELSAIIIAGAAGIILGNAWLFPGTYSRVVSLKRNARDALKIIVSLIPIFVVAAILESYVTRHYMALGLTGRLIIILLSAAIIIWYFILYPIKVNQQRTKEALNLTPATVFDDQSSNNR